MIILLVTSELHLCPKCGKGHLRPTANFTKEVDPFRQTNSLQIFVCDYCGMKKSNVGTENLDANALTVLYDNYHTEEMTGKGEFCQVRS